MNLLLETIRALLEVSEDRIIDWAKQFKTLEEFMSVISSGGYGFKPSSYIYRHMNVNTRGRLADNVKTNIANEGDWWILSNVPTSAIKETHTSSMRDDVQDVDMTVPLVLGSKMQIIDGRHRHYIAKQSGVGILKAWMPAEVFYYLKIQ